MNVTLRDITMDNFRECIRLEVDEAQRSFVASNVYSLAEAKADGVSQPRAIYADEQLVGFTMFDVNPEESCGYMTRLMIDARFQGRGYGRAALQLVLEQLRAAPACREIRTSYEPTNAVAERLYESVGFRKTGEIVDGEIVLRMPVD